MKVSMRTATTALLSAALAVCGAAPASLAAGLRQPIVESRSKPVLRLSGLSFRDMNGDGALQPYEDWRLTPERRADDLVRRMTLEEKAGQMMHGTAPSNWPTIVTTGPAQKGYYLADAQPMIDKGVGSLITRLTGEPGFLAEENNKLQALAEATRLGVPLVVSTDPRNHFSAILGLSVAVGQFSQWPETLGFAAIGDEALMRRFGDVARQEYRAVGIHQALSPQADLATEPRWPRISGTFGEDPELARRMVRAYVRGFQGSDSGVARDGVLTVVKHWTGYGAAKDGWDSHNPYGRFADFSGGGFEAHLIPWKGAFEAGTSGVMPTYSILEGVRINGKPLEPVGAGFSKTLLTDLLRGRFGFRGVILSDWAITNDCPAACQGDWKPGSPPTLGMPWGVESLTRTQRFAKAIQAGVDQFGGVTESEKVVEAVRTGLVSEARIDQSVRRLLIQKIRIGLFENPYADTKAAGALGGRGFQAEADRAQARSLVVLENRGLLPLKPGQKVYLKGVEATAARAAGLTVVDRPEAADVAIVRADAPYQKPHPNYFFGDIHHEGDLDFKPGDPQLQSVMAIAEKVPTILTVYLDRPAVLTPFKGKVAALIGNFGVADGPLLSALTGKVRPEGRLPFELPSSMAEVRAQKSSLPHDTASPAYPIFAGGGF